MLQISHHYDSENKLEAANVDEFSKTDKCFLITWSFLFKDVLLYSQSAIGCVRI